MRAKNYFKARRIAVTGICGEWGRVFLNAIKRKNPFEFVLGIDLKPPNIQIQNFSFHQQDLQDNQLGKVFKKYAIDTVLHLAFLLRLDTPKKVAVSVNVLSIQNVLSAFIDSGAQSFILGSSNSVYGAYPDNPDILTETSQPRPNKDHLFAVLKRRMETEVAEVEEKHKDKRFVVLRRGTLLSHYVRPSVPVSLFNSPFSPFFLFHNPPLQFIHEKDLGKITVLALKKPVSGIYNVVSDGHVSYLELIARSGNIPVLVPGTLAKTAAKFLETLGLLTPISGGLDYFMFPWLCSNKKIKQALKYKFSFTSKDAVNAVFNSHREKPNRQKQ